MVNRMWVGSDVSGGGAGLFEGLSKVTKENNRRAQDIWCTGLASSQYRLRLSQCLLLEPSYYVNT